MNKVINFEDFVPVANNFGQTGTLWKEGNFNLDDVTNFADFVLVANNFGMTFASEILEVPEPSVFALLSKVLVTGLVRRKLGEHRHLRLFDFSTL